ncbi:hypothetical protein A2U01_0007024, partial [Trifolium medium]|nr:hypothetical protein [Trifolium medium]
DLKDFVVAQYSTHFAELQTILVVKTSLSEISDIKTFVIEHCSTHFDELTTIVREQQSSLDAIHGSLKMIEVVMCTKPTNDNHVEKQAKDSNHVITIDDSNPVITIEDDKNEEGDKNEEQDPTGSRGKRKSVSNDYDFELEKELANTDLVFSDGDYEYHADDMNKRICQTVNNLNMQIKQNVQIHVLPDAWTSVDNMGKSNDHSNPMRFSNSDFKRVSKDSITQDDIEELHGISKKLFESPFTTPPASSQPKRGSSSTKAKKAMTGSTSSGAKRYRSVLPKGIKWNFSVTSDMKLDLSELQALAYVYHPNKDKS